MNSLPSRRARIENLLHAAFAPQALEVIDESDRHAGHSGARPEGETHFRVVMKAESLNHLPRLARHRAVNAALAAEFAGGLHALALDV